MATRYKVIQQNTGGGGFGKIDKAEENVLERFVAIKTLDPLFKMKPSQDDIERFKREAKILAKLTHPNIPAIYDVVFNEEEEEFKLICEWIEGLTVRLSLEKKGLNVTRGCENMVWQYMFRIGTRT